MLFSGHNLNAIYVYKMHQTQVILNYIIKAAVDNVKVFTWAVSRGLTIRVVEVINKDRLNSAVGRDEFQ